MIRAEEARPNGIAARAIAMRDSDRSLPALVQRAANQLASATTAAEVLEARDSASVVYDAAKKAARLARAKGAHDELIAKAHRAQADALEIEAAAKRRLADEYDGAQQRGELQRRGGDGTSKTEVPTASDIGLTHKDIHEARQIRDAELAVPGIVERTIDQQLNAGLEPTKAALRKAVTAAVTKEAEGEKMEAAEAAQATKSHGRTIFIPEGEDIVGLCHRGLALEKTGMTSEEAAAKINLARQTYGVCRQIVLLAENADLSANDKATAQEALRLVVETGKWATAWEMAEPLANRVWGEGNKYDLLSIAAKRLDRFELSFGIVMQACMTTDEINLPYLTADQAKDAVKQIGKARAALLRFAERIKEIHE